MKNILLAIFTLAAFQFGTAQEFTLSFNNPLVDNENNPTQLCVEIDIAYTASATLGYSNVVFNYDEAVFTNPAINTDFLNATDSDYSLNLVTRNIDNTTSDLVVDLGIIYDYLSATPLTLTGSSDCTTSQKVAEICFDILNASAITNLSWVYDGDGASSNLNINTHINDAGPTNATQLNDSNNLGCTLVDLTIDIPNTPDDTIDPPVCNATVQFSNETVAAGTYQSSDLIETLTPGTVSIASGTTVVFDAGNTVILRAGFSAPNGSTFTAKIGGCTPAPTVNDDPVVASRGQEISAGEYQLQVMPNPVASQATIRFHNPEEGYIAITIYDFNGAVVEQLHQQYALKGWNQLNFYPKNLSSGLYFVTLRSKDIVKSERFVVQAD